MCEESDLKLFRDKEKGIRSDYMKEMASKHLVLHFDGKILKHIDEESKHQLIGLPSQLQVLNF